MTSRLLQGIFLMLVPLLAQVHAIAQHAYWQQKTDYRIEVSLDDKAKTLDGFLQLTYTNNSPDTLHYIWFHLWPNAYKNDRTAFSDQLLENGNTAFYFTDDKNKGYINRLDFRQSQNALRVEDHPEYIDVVKVLLEEPLRPGSSTVITTPFHVKMPFRFSRSGYTKDDIAVTQWYPKPAVYDSSGWHPMPYLDQGEFYSEFGDYDVTIKVPQGYKVAATGVKKEIEPYRYIQKNVIDFAWFASREYESMQDTVALASGKIVTVTTYYFPESAVEWKEALQMAKDALRFRSKLIGDYPYDVATIVQGLDAFEGGMEYPTITLISGDMKGRMLDFIIEHELGHNWFQSSLATNEREHPWMDEGMNTYFDYKYIRWKYGTSNILVDGSTPATGAKRKLLSNLYDLGLDLMNSLGVDQAIAAPSYEFTKINNSLVPYHKAARWMEKIEALIGEEQMRSVFNDYYATWKNKHPQPENFRSIVNKYASDKKVDSVYNLMYQPSSITERRSKIKTRATFGFNLAGADSIRYISVLPAIGYNRYDKFMIGAALHNYNARNPKFNFLLTPLYATGSKQLNGYLRLSYRDDKFNTAKRMTAGLDLMRFSKRAAMDTLGNTLYENFLRVSPFVRYYLPQTERSSVRRFFEFRTFLIREKEFSAFGSRSDSTETIYVTGTEERSRYINQLSYHYQNNRALYPYNLLLQMQQGKGFYRLNLDAAYFFNYPKYGGLSVRLFASKFGYLNDDFKTDASAFRYMPKLMGVNGEEDYTYSNYFVGRTATYASAYESIENAGLAAQQIMNRDGGLKMRLDYFDFLQGRSDNWIAALNLNTTLPDKLLPIRLPLRLFMDFGTTAEYWKSHYEGPRFMYVGGVQVSVFKSILNVYVPLIYSAEIRDNLKTLPELNTFKRRLTFSIDIHRINLRMFSANQLPL